MPDGLRRVVSDTGPLITLERLPGGFALLRRLYDQVLLPEQVFDELSYDFESKASYLEHFGIEDLITVRNVEVMDPELARLDLGEQAALTLAIDNGLPLLIEERAGRSLAKAKGVPYSGIAGQILKAHRLDLLPRADAVLALETLFERGRIPHRILRELRQHVLDRMADENQLH